MTTNLLLLGRIAFLLGLLAGLVAYVGYFGTATSRGRVLLQLYASSLDKDLRFLRARVSGQRLLAGQVLIGVSLLSASALFGGWVFVSILPAVVFGPRAFVTKAVARRASRIDEQIEGWLNAVANSLKASPSLGEALASTISLTAPPMSEEVSVLVKECEFGIALDVALDNFAARVGSKTLEGTVLALKVARNSGGNLPETLENASAALRELARLEGVVRTKTAEGKAQSFVIGAVPLPLVAGLHAMDPNYFVPLTNNFVGHLALAVALVLWALAVLGARKILAVDV